MRGRRGRNMPSRCNNSGIKTEKMNRYELFSHPADQGIRGYGETKEEAFQEIAKALQSLMVKIEEIEIKTEDKIRIKATDEESLLVNWLNELLYLFDVKGNIYKEFEVKIENNELTATARGEKHNPEKHGSEDLVKAITYNQLEIKEEKGKWMAQCVVDV